MGFPYVGAGRQLTVDERQCAETARHLAEASINERQRFADEIEHRPSSIMIRWDVLADARLAVALDMGNLVEGLWGGSVTVRGGESRPDGALWLQARGADGRRPRLFDALESGIAWRHRPR